jgi:very-short-patch-repair endonuclease
MPDDEENSRFSHTRKQTQHARKLRRNASKTERKLWPHLRDGQLGAPFRRQHRIAGKFADYSCVPLKLVVEVDGPLHDIARDSVRDHRMNRQGFDVMRFSVQEIDENLEGVVSTIYDAVQLRLLQQQVEKSDSGKR